MWSSPLPAIDPAQISAQQTLSGLDVLNIPYAATHDYRNVLNFIPGVVQDVHGQPHVAGAETYQTVTLLDGFNITQPANGQLLARISTDAFRSIQVEPAREPAEFGKGSGGLLHAEYRNWQRSLPLLSPPISCRPFKTREDGSSTRSCRA